MLPSLLSSAFRHPLGKYDEGRLQKLARVNFFAQEWLRRAIGRQATAVTRNLQKYKSNNANG
jgi:hypothetical protein